MKFIGGRWAGGGGVVITGEYAFDSDDSSTRTAEMVQSDSSGNKHKKDSFLDSSVIVPATKLARKQLSDSQDDARIDREIQKHFLGMV